MHLMLAMLVMSLAAMVVGKRKIMFAGLGCVAAMCVFLKSASNNDFKLPPTNDAKCSLEVAHINLANLDDSTNQITELLRDQNIELVSFQELTPDWAPLLDDVLKSAFPYSVQEVRIDPFGIAVYSKYPFVVSDTFMYEDKPAVQTVVEKDGRQFEIISSYLIPAFDQQSQLQAAGQLSKIAEHVTQSDLPLISLGEFNMVYWAHEIRTFRARTGLINSRRDISQSNLRLPYDHIFFSDQLECTRFEELRGKAANNYLGICGSYQIKAKKEYETLNRKLSLAQ